MPRVKGFGANVRVEIFSPCNSADFGDKMAAGQAVQEIIRQIEAIGDGSPIVKVANTEISETSRVVEDEEEQPTGQHRQPVGGAPAPPAIEQPPRLALDEAQRRAEAG